MISILASGKTKEARQQLRSINQKLFDGFLKDELKQLRKQKEITQIVKGTPDKESKIYQFAQCLAEKKNMDSFKNAIKLQSESKGTKREGLFYKLIFSIMNQLDDVSKTATLKSKIKAFLLATNDKDNTINDDDVTEDDKQSKRMKNSNLIQKLNSNRVSNVLKAFITLVAWDYVYINEEAKRKAEEEAKHKVEEEATRKAEEEATRKAEEEAKHKAEEEAKRKAEEEAKRKAEEEAKRKAKEEAERKAEKEKENTIENCLDQAAETMENCKESLNINDLRNLALKFQYLKTFLGKIEYEKRLSEFLKRYYEKLSAKLPKNQKDALFYNIINPTAKTGDGCPYFRYCVDGNPSRIKLTNSQGVILGDLVNFENLKHKCPTAFECNVHDHNKVTNLLRETYRIPNFFQFLVTDYFGENGPTRADFNKDWKFKPFSWKMLANCKYIKINLDLMTCISDLNIITK